jgi:hypothetical protein
MATAATHSREWIRTSEAARIAGVSEQTMRRNAQTKFNIQVRKRPGQAMRLYRLADVLRYKAEVEQSENETARP